MTGLALALLFATTPEAPLTLSWAELVQRMEAESPLMHAANAGLERFEETLKGAQWAYSPQLRVESALAPTPTLREDKGEVSVDMGTWGYYYRVGLTLIQPLYSFGKLKSLRESAERGLDIGQAQVEIARWELRVRAARAYEGALFARELEQLLEDGASWFTKVEARLDSQRAAGDERYDQLAHLRLKSRLGELALMRSDNRALLAHSEEALGALLSGPARSIRPRAERLSARALKLAPLDHYLALAEGSRPTLRSARARASSVAAQADALAAGLWPELVLMGELSAVGSDVLSAPGAIPGDRPPGVAAGVLLGVSWELDIAQTLAQSRATRAAAKQQDLRAQALSDDVAAEVRRLYRDLARQPQVLKGMEEASVAARSWLRTAWDLYDSGFGQLKEVLDALDQFSRVEVQRLQTLMAHNLLVVELSRAVGHDITQSSGDTP